LLSSSSSVFGCFGVKPCTDASIDFCAPFNMRDTPRTPNTATTTTINAAMILLRCTLHVARTCSPDDATISSGGATSRRSTPPAVPAPASAPATKPPVWMCPAIRSIVELCNVGACGACGNWMVDAIVGDAVVDAIVGVGAVAVVVVASAGAGGDVEGAARP